MFARLQGMGLAQYELYRWASLTRRGRLEALRLVRRHRLIETFLLEHLGYSRGRMYTRRPSGLSTPSPTNTRSAWPSFWAIWSVIPTSDGALPPEDSRPLSSTEAGGRVVVSRVENRDPAVFTYLRDLGLMSGRALWMREVRAGRRRHRGGRGRDLPRPRRTACAFHPGQTLGVGEAPPSALWPEDLCSSNSQLVALFLVADCHVWE
jgi:hypothetical protein